MHEMLSALQHDFDLAKVYAATEGQFLAYATDTSVHTETQQQDLFDDALDLGVGLGLSLGEQEQLKPFKRFPYYLYKQHSGRMLFDLEVERLMDTKPAGKQFGKRSLVQLLVHFCQTC